MMMKGMNILVCVQLLFATFTEVISFSPTTRTRTTTRTTTTTTASPYRRKTALFSTGAASGKAFPSMPSGLSKTVTKEGKGTFIKTGKVATVTYSCYVKNSAKPFAKGEKEQVMVGDGKMIDAWDIALRSMKEGERSVIRIEDPLFGYGSQGIPPYVPPNAILEMDIEVTRVSELDLFGLDKDLDIATTPEEIKQAYEERMALVEPQKTGLEGFIERLRTSYIFGFFEGETGQEAPWYLKPSITFPLAFAILGGAFATLYLGGGINERGIDVEDELDKVILTNNMMMVLISSVYNNYTP